MRLKFTKMHGLGNDFVMLDGVSNKLKLSSDKVQHIADRHFGIGCDQLLIVEPPQNPKADFRYRIFNQDGGEVENCGNGARCFAQFVRERELTSKHRIVVETKAGLMVLNVQKDGLISVNMGVPELKPEKIPFKTDRQSITYPLTVGNKTFDISAVSMGNPHAVTIVDDVDNFKVHRYGPAIESHKLFPNRVNAGFLQITSSSTAKLRVFERGVGETLACGTGACAAMVAGRLQGKFEKTVTIVLKGGTLKLNWPGEGKPVTMTGPATTVFHGQVKI